MAENRAIPNRQYGRVESARLRQLTPPDRVNGAVDAMEPAKPDASADARFREPDRVQLGGGDHPVLPVCDRLHVEHP